MGSSAGLFVRCVPDVLVHNGRAVELLFPPPDRCNFRCISTQAAELHLKDDKMTPMQYFHSSTGKASPYYSKCCSQYSLCLPQIFNVKKAALMVDC